MQRPPFLRPVVAFLALVLGSVLFWSLARIGWLSQQPAPAPASGPQSVLVQFSTAVKPAELAKQARVLGPNGETLAAEWQPIDSSSKTFALRTKGIPARVVVAKGFTSLNGSVRLADDLVLNYPENFAALGRAPKSEKWEARGGEGLVSEIEWEDYSAKEQSIRIAFAKPVDVEALRRSLTVTEQSGDKEEPLAVKLDRDSAAKEFTATFAVANPLDAHLHAVVAAGLESVDGTKVATNFEQILTRRIEANSLEGAEFNIADYGPDASMVLELKFTREVDVDTLREQLQITPPVKISRVDKSWSWNRDTHNYRVYANWASRTKYRIGVRAGMPDSEGFPASEMPGREVLSDDVPPMLRISEPGKFFFPRTTSPTLTLASRNVPTARVTAYRVFPESLPYAVNAGSEMGSPDSSFAENWAEEIATTKVKLRSVKDSDSTTRVPFKDILPDGARSRGLFVLEVEGDEVSATKLALVTRLGVLCHWQEDAAAVAVHDLRTLESVKGATVSVYSKKNQVIAKGTTDDSGITHLSGFRNQLGSPSLIVVETADDYTFLNLEPRTEDRQAMPNGASWPEGTPYEAYVYADRELIRPGETIHLGWLLRSWDESSRGTSVAGVPVLLTITKPNGQAILQSQVTTSDFGAATHDFTTGHGFPTGGYSATITLPGSGLRLGEYDFQVEDFVPTRMEAKLRVAGDSWIMGEKRSIVANATNLQGGPTAGAKVTFEVALSNTVFRSEKWKGFAFGDDSLGGSDRVMLADGMTDDSGAATCEWLAKLRSDTPPTVPVQADFLAYVYSPSGRPVRAGARTTIFPDKAILGLSVAAGNATGELAVDVAAISPDGEAASPGDITVTLERVVWNYWNRRYVDRDEPSYKPSFEPVADRVVVLKEGRGRALFQVPAEYGSWRVRATSAGTRAVAATRFSSAGSHLWLDSESRPDLAKVLPQKSVVAIGEQTSVRIESPFDGLAIAVVENDKIRRMIRSEVRAGVGEILLTLDRDCFPNVCVAVTVVRHIEPGTTNSTPASAFGAATISVRDPERILNVEIANLPAEIQPLTALEFDVVCKGGDGNAAAADITVAVVDEGIHAITGYQSPDPLEWLTRLRDVRAKRAHYYDRIMLEDDGAEPGGDGSGMAARLSAPGRKWIVPLALWSGKVRTDADGKAHFKFAIPDYNGKVRLCVVASSERAVGSADAKLVIRRPVDFDIHLPTFVLPGDRFQPRIQVFNNTAQPVRIHATMAGDCRIVPNETSTTLEVKANATALVPFDAQAPDSPTSATMVCAVEVLGADGAIVTTLRRDLPLPVLQPSTYSTRSRLAIVKPGETATFAPDGYIADSRLSSAIAVSANPLQQLRGALDYNITYPYGCVEQLSSRLFALYVVRLNLDLAPPQMASAELVDDAIGTGIRRIVSLQGYRGGLTVWPGEQSTYPYGSVYGLHALTLAKRRGYEVPAEALEQLRNYVQRVATEPEFPEVDAHTKCYAIYVLALGGDTEILHQIPSLEKGPLTEASRAMLASAVALHVNQPDRIAALLRGPVAKAKLAPASGSLTSEFRDNAVKLLALRDVPGSETQAAIHFEKLAAQLAANRVGNTQENAFAITALSEWLHAHPIDTAKAGASISGPAGLSRTLAGSQVVSAKANSAEPFVVKNTGSTNLYIYHTAAGVPTVPPQPESTSGIVLKKTIFDRRGKEVEPTKLVRDTAYIMLLNIELRDATDNLVLTDMFPAGLELENARLAEEFSPVDTEKTATEPDSVDMRDDRLLLFWHRLGKGTHTYSYTVQAVTPGDYLKPETSAECMYDAQLRGSTGTGRVVIK